MSNEFKLYYDNNGKVITYTTEILPNQNFIIITREQYAEARPDVLVKDGKIVYTNCKKQIFKLEKGDAGTRTSKFDINILTNDIPNSVFWTTVIYDID